MHPREKWYAYFMITRVHSKSVDKIPEPTLRRLPWYLSNAKLMKEKGGTYVSSHTQISKQINIDASQISQRPVLCGSFRKYTGGVRN